ncbi:MAG: hypothetical protein CME55_00345 [Halieaceae bacterium]|nr:hypothetical protein [Halieaceae bacterium]|tara:strand:- start:2104 stop:2283 length:180 start_codon:yes stop_codon:yes gene_type:complete
MTEPSPYFAARRSQWRDKKFQPTSEWSAAEFLYEQGALVRINKGPNPIHEMVAEVHRRS